MLIKPLLAEMSGKLAGLVASHNRGGQYLRQFRVPTDPNTARQVAVRNAFAYLSSEWHDNVTDKGPWATYGANVGSVNALGDPIPLTGQQAFIRCNAPRIPAGASVIYDAPTLMNKTPLTLPVVSYSVGAGDVSVAFTAGDEWAISAQGLLYLYASGLVSAARVFYKGPFGALGFVAGNQASPQVPSLLTLPFTPAAGNVFWVRMMAQADDGRLSDPVIQRVVAAV